MANYTRVLDGEMLMIEYVLQGSSVVKGLCPPVFTSFTLLHMFLLSYST